MVWGKAWRPRSSAETGRRPQTLPLKRPRATIQDAGWVCRLQSPSLSDRRLQPPRCLGSWESEADALGHGSRLRCQRHLDSSPGQLDGLVDNGDPEPLRHDAVQPRQRLANTSTLDRRASPSLFNYVQTGPLTRFRAGPGPHSSRPARALHYRDTLAPNRKRGPTSPRLQTLPWSKLVVIRFVHRTNGLLQWLTTATSTTQAVHGYRGHARRR